MATQASPPVEPSERAAVVERDASPPPTKHELPSPAKHETRADDDRREADEEVAVAPPPTPSTLAPAAYDAPSAANGATEDDLLEGSVGGARPGFFSRAGARAAVGGLVVLLGLWVVLRARHAARPVDTSSPEPAAQAAAAASPTVVLPEVPVEPDEQPAAQGAPVDDATALELQRRARELLTSGQIVEGVAYARRAIAARPLDSDNYILLAAGLQDLGQWQQARNIFSQCVRRSGGPATTECQYFATQGN